MIFVYLVLYLILDYICKSNGWDKPSRQHSEEESYAMATAITDEEAFYDAFK